MTNVIQLGFDPEDSKVWWIDEYKWEDDSVGNVYRPTEVIAFKQMFRQSRLIRKRGLLVHLSTLQREALRMEFHALRTTPKPDNVYNWIAARMHRVSPLDIKMLLDECSFVMLLRDALGMQPLQFEWVADDSAVKRAA